MVAHAVAEGAAPGHLVPLMYEVAEDRVPVRRQPREDLVELAVRDTARDPVRHHRPVKPTALAAEGLHRVMVRVRPPAPPRPVKRERVDQRPAPRVSFLAEERQGEVDAFDFTEPALGLGSDPAGQKVALDLVKAGQHLRINADHGASQASVLMLARSRVGPGAPAQFDFALVEVLLEPEPFDAGHGAVLVGRARLAAAEVCLVVADEVLVEYRDIAPV